MAIHLAKSDLRTTNHAQIAYALTDGLLQLIEERPEHGGKSVAEALRAVRNAVWAPAIADHYEERAKIRAERKELFSEILNGLAGDHEERQFMEGYARMGHLYELAALIARENLINQELGGASPGGLEAFIAGCDTAEEALDALECPVFEMVMTAHPTNVNSQAFIRAQRELGCAINAIESDADLPAFEQALKAFLTTPLLNHNEGELNNLSVQDETDLTLYYLSNLYDDISMVYEAADRAFMKKAAQSYDPLALRLNLKFGSWGSSGDKDGNSKVTADTTLDAIASHKKAILQHYTRDLKQHGHPRLKPWLEIVETALDAVESMQKQLHRAMKENGGLKPDRFDHFAQMLSQAIHALDAGAFEESVTQAYREKADTGLLALVRRIRTFGFEFAKIEYRENAEEYGRVLAELIPGYFEKTMDEREALLTEILQTPGKAERISRAAMPRIQKSSGQPYSADNAQPIAYQTLKRMELARDFPKIIRDNVLAEFTHPAQLLEAVFLQQAVGAGEHVPLLGIIPLFESPESMGDAALLMKRAYQNPAYKAHLQAVAGAGETPVQQIQIAHSDNARRSGLPAARAFIFDTHRELRETADESGVNVQFFEGGSSSDLYRGGVRAISAAVRTYGLYDFAKFTFQGGDLLNYINYPPSTKRLFSRNMAGSAAYFAGGFAKPASWKTRLQEMNGKDPALVAPVQNTIEAFFDDVACRALKATLEDYRSNAFTRTGLGHLLKELGYDEEKLAGTAGSRAPARAGGGKVSVRSLVNEAPDAGEVVFGKVSATQASELRAVDIYKTRTITFSEALQHGGLVPTMVGARTMYHNVRHELNAVRRVINHKLEKGEALSPGEQELCNHYPPDSADNTRLTPDIFHAFFDQSRLFRDVIIRIAIGASLTDFDQLRENHPRLKHDPFLNQLEDEYRDAMNMALMAMTGKYPEELMGEQAGEERFAGIASRTLRHLMVDHVTEMQQILEDKTRYLGFVQAIKAHARQKGEVLDDYDRRLLHNAGDTVTHGRMLPVDDPALGAYLRRKLKNVQAETSARRA